MFGALCRKLNVVIFLRFHSILRAGFYARLVNLLFVFNVKWGTRNKHHDAAGFVHSTQRAEAMCSCSFEIVFFWCDSTSFWTSDTIWNLPQSYTQTFDYVLSGFSFLYSGNTKRRNTRLTTATHDKIYDFLFNLPCLLQRLVDYTILFSLFLHNGHCSQIVVMRLVGGFFFFYSTRLIHSESLDWGFFSLASKISARPTKDKNHLIMLSTN